MNRNIIVPAIIVLVLLATIAPITLASPLPRWNELPGNLVTNPSLEQGLNGWNVYDETPILDSGIAYHGSKSAYLDWIHSGHTQMIYQYIPKVFNFILIFHIYCFSDNRNYQFSPIYKDKFTIYNSDSDEIGIMIDYYYNKLILFTRDGIIDTYKAYEMNLPVDRWVTITVVKINDKALFYVDGKYITTLAAPNRFFNVIGSLHSGYHGPWVWDAVYVGRIPILSLYSHGGSGTHYEDTVKNTLKAKVYATSGNNDTASTYIEYKVNIGESKAYVFYIPVEYRISYGIEYGGYVYAKLVIRVLKSDGAEIDTWVKYLVYRMGAISESKTVQGTEKYIKLLNLDPGTYYVEVSVTLYANGWYGDAYVDMYSTNYYVDLFILGSEK